MFSPQYCPTTENGVFNLDIMAGLMPAVMVGKLNDGAATTGVTDICGSYLVASAQIGRRAAATATKHERVKQYVQNWP